MENVNYLSVAERCCGANVMDVQQRINKNKTFFYRSLHEFGAKEYSDKLIVIFTLYRVDIGKSFRCLFHSHRGVCTCGRKAISGTSSSGCRSMAFYYFAFIFYVLRIRPSARHPSVSNSARLASISSSKVLFVYNLFYAYSITRMARGS